MLTLHNRFNPEFGVAESGNCGKDTPMATDEIHLTVAAVARQLGVAPATLRTWDRRYGLGPTTHQTGAHRRYSPNDLARLMLMRRLISTGVSPGEAAERAKTHKAQAHAERIIPEFESREELVLAIYKAAKRSDVTFIESELKRDLAEFGVESSWSQVMVPVLSLLGRDWESVGKGVEVEHMTTEIIKRTFRSSISTIDAPLNSRPVLLAAVGEEQHNLPLHALAAALAERNIQTLFLGARTPLDALSAVVSQSAPPAIFLWAQLEENADPGFFRDLPAVRPAPRIVLGGPGWDRDGYMEVVVVEDLSQACLEIERAVGV